MQVHADQVAQRIDDLQTRINKARLEVAAMTDSRGRPPAPAIDPLRRALDTDLSTVGALQGRAEELSYFHYLATEHYPVPVFEPTTSPRLLTASQRDDAIEASAILFSEDQRTLEEHEARVAELLQQPVLEDPEDSAAIELAVGVLGVLGVLAIAATALFDALLTLHVI